MAAKYDDRIYETTTTTGTGTLDLGGAATGGFRAFADSSVIASGNSVFYVIVDDVSAPTQYEVGIGTYTAGSPDTLSRDTVIASSNSNNKVSWAAGTKGVLSVAPSQYLRKLLRMEAETELTIDDGAVTGTQFSHSIDTESDAATDDLDTIATTNYTSGDLVLIRAENAARTAVAKHGTGNLSLAGAADFSLDDTDKWLLLRLDTSTWVEVFRSWGSSTAPAASGANADITSLSGLLSINGASFGQQLLIGGDFNLNPWQRGTSFTAATTPANDDATYLADRWALISDGDDIVDVSQDTDGSLKCLVATANKQFGLVQIVSADNAAAVMGDVISAAMRAKASGLSTLRLAVLNWTGTADSPTLDVVGTWAGGGTEPTWATNWTREGDIVDLTLGASYATAKAENISLDTASGKQFAIVVWLDDTDGAVSDTLNISWISCVPGSTHPTTPPRRLKGEERGLCQEYLYRIQPGGEGKPIAVGFALSSTRADVYLEFKCTMRTKNPAISVSNGAHFHIFRNAGAEVVTTSLNGAEVSDEGAQVIFNVASGLSAGEGAILRTDNSAAWIQFTAELGV